MGWIRDLLLGENDDRDQGTHSETVPIQSRGRCNTHGRYDKPDVVH